MFAKTRYLRDHLRRNALHRAQHLTVVATTVEKPQATLDASVGRYRPCECCVLDPGDWPWSNAEVVLRPCTKACPYCGRVFYSAYKLQKHINLSQAHTWQKLKARGVSSNRNTRRFIIGVAQNEAHDASNQGSPINKNSSNSGADGGDNGDFAETNIENHSSAAPQNDAHDTRNQTHPISESPLLSIDSRNDHSHLASNARSVFCLTAVQSGAHDDARQESPMNHTSCIGLG
ncbi:hypothetical protein V493_08160 [Pseudogymnoascus sp. VKM F-4281 (FW-2241)]|nr:hypothetical protein V493_08160 [Pseudogymnoascus sp. VKM F-4281 (FW-2241)]